MNFSSRRRSAEPFASQIDLCIQRSDLSASVYSSSIIHSNFITIALYIRNIALSNPIQNGVADFAPDFEKMQVSERPYEGDEKGLEQQPQQVEGACMSATVRFLA